MCLWVSFKKKNKNMKIIFFASLKLLKKGIGSGDGSRSGSISQKYGSGDPDPDRHQNVTDPQQTNAGLSLQKKNPRRFREGTTPTIRHNFNEIENPEYIRKTEKL
jgi:hypothetical protein